MIVKDVVKVVVKVADLQNGDTVEVSGKLETVSIQHLNTGFTGATYKGDPHFRGIVRVTFQVPGSITLRGNFCEH